MRPLTALLLAGVVLAACGSDTPDAPAAEPVAEPTAEPAGESAAAEPSADSAVAGQPVIDPGDGGNYEVMIDPATFTSRVSNPFMPLIPGARWVYRATSPDGDQEVITVEVLDERRVVMGVEAIVVHDVVTTVDGEMVEDTYDWFAQDAAGNVWYFGEDTTAYENGKPHDDGSWTAGVDGALPGIVMYADPAVSERGYRQEYLVGAAEDMGQVIALDVAVTVPAGSYQDTVRTRDWTPLEPDAVEEKTYADGVGAIHERKVAGDGTGAETVLVEFTPGKA